MEVSGAVSAWIKTLKHCEASVGTSKMDHGMESNDGRQKMDQGWNQVFEMLERAELSGFVVESNFKYEHAPSGPLAGSTAPPNLINLSNHTGSVRSALCERPLKVATKSYHCQSESCESVSHDHETRVKYKNRNETKVYSLEKEKSRAWTSSFHCVNNAHLCNCLFKDNTQSCNYLSQSCKAKEQSHVKSFEGYDQSEKQFRHSEMEKYGAQELGFGIDYSTSCSRPFKDNTQTFCQSNSFVKCAAHVNENQNSGIKT